MTDNRTRIDGPHPITIQAIPAGARIDISRTLETFVLALLRDYREELEDLGKIDDAAEHQRSHGNTDSYAGHERDAKLQALIEAVGGDIVIHGAKVGEMADALGEIARPKPVPGQSRRAS
ncbi:hypothetical protein ABZ883_14595 [Streptomyces sp. NPDC046977]|uniref:hypothetical protein n=1 Tax=Streptomyces sp. NPDC046977 TaxID=3154703 RepID=UPI0033F9680C